MPGPGAGREPLRDGDSDPRVLRDVAPPHGEEYGAGAEPGGPAGRPGAVQPDATIEVPAGTLRAGSSPGTSGRRASVEADLVPVPLGAFRIDRLPYPNRPGERFRTGVTRAEAEGLCQARAMRLCTELEWERACEGERGALYPTGAHYDHARCLAAPEGCPSPFGVMHLGVGFPEWTSSASGARFDDAAPRAIVRGSGTANPSAHRCAARQAIASTSTREGAGFRCCAGPANDVPYPSEEARPSFVDDAVPLEVLRAALAQVPELASFAERFRPFEATEIARALAGGRVDPALPADHRAMERVLRWSPAPGELCWVVAGRAAGTSLLAVLYPLPDGSFVHGASMVLEGDPSPVAVTYDRATPRTLQWSSCFGCAGEGGEVQHRDDGRVVIVAH